MPLVDPKVFELGLPVLGFCYGQQIMAVTLGGTVGHTEKGEYGHATLTREGESRRCLTAGTVWMSHRDAVSAVPEGFKGHRPHRNLPGGVDGMPRAQLYATQFHPEVRHTPNGQDMLSNFLFKICGSSPTDHGGHHRFDDGRLSALRWAATA